MEGIKKGIGPVSQRRERDRGVLIIIRSKNKRMKIILLNMEFNHYRALRGGSIDVCSEKKERKREYRCGGFVLIKKKDKKDVDSKKD